MSDVSSSLSRLDGRLLSTEPLETLRQRLVAAVGVDDLPLALRVDARFIALIGPEDRLHQRHGQRDQLHAVLLAAVASLPA